MSKKKIVFCMHQIVMGGIEKILCQILSDLTEKGEYSLTVVSKRKVTDKYFKDYFAKNNIKLIDKISIKRPHFFLWKKLHKILKPKSSIERCFHGADLIIDFCNFSFEPELRKIKTKKIAWCHGSILFFVRNNLIEKIPTYDKLVCLSDNFLNKFKDIYPEYKNKITRLYNPLNISEIRKISGKKLCPPEKYFIHISRLDGMDKDLVTVIKAFDLFYQKNKDVKLYIVGDGVQKEYLEQISASNPNIVFCGRVDEPYSLISGALALILSSSTTIGEGLGLVLVEAQILKTLAISSNVPSGPAEILLDGKAGVLFPPQDFKALSNILLDVAQNPKKYNNMIETATENLKRFDVKNIKLSNLIQEIIDSTQNDYDFVCSIGRDCASSFYLKDHKLRSCSGPFDWLSVATFSQRFDMLLNNFKDFMNPKLFEFLPKNPKGLNDNSHDYYKNTKTNFEFYHDFPMGIPFEESFPEISEKYNRRIKRMYKQIKKNEKVLMVWLSHFTQTSDKEIVDLCSRFCKKMHKNIDFLIIEHREGKERPECRKLNKNITVWHLCTLDKTGQEPVIGNANEINKIFSRYKLTQ